MLNLLVIHYRMDKIYTNKQQFGPCGFLLMDNVYYDQTMALFDGSSDEKIDELVQEHENPEKIRRLIQNVDESGLYLPDFLDENESLHQIISGPKFLRDGERYVSATGFFSGSNTHFIVATEKRLVIVLDNEDNPPDETIDLEDVTDVWTENEGKRTILGINTEEAKYEFTVGERVDDLDDIKSYFQNKTPNIDYIPIEYNDSAESSSDIDPSKYNKKDILELKKEADDLFERGKYDQAIDIYTDIINIAEEITVRDSMLGIVEDEEAREIVGLTEEIENKLQIYDVKKEIDQQIEYEYDKAHISAYKLHSNSPTLRKEGAQEFLSLAREDTWRAIKSVPVFVERSPDDRVRVPRIVSALTILLQNNTEELLSIAPNITEFIAEFLEVDEAQREAIRGLAIIADVSPNHFNGDVSEMILSDVVSIINTKSYDEEMRSDLMRLLAVTAETSPVKFENMISKGDSKRLINILIDHLNHSEDQEYVIRTLIVLADIAPRDVDEKTSDIILKIQNNPKSIRKVFENFPTDIIRSAPEINELIIKQLHNKEQTQSIITTLSKVIQRNPEKIKKTLSDFDSDQVINILVDQMKSEKNQYDTITVLYYIINESDQLSVDISEFLSPTLITSFIERIYNKEYRDDTIRVLSTISRKSPGQMDAVTSKLTDDQVLTILIKQLENQEYRSEVIDILAIVSESAPEKLEEGMPDIVATTRADPEALIKIGHTFPLTLVSATPQLIEAIIEQLQDDEYRPDAVKILAQIATENPHSLEDNLPAITAALGDDREDVKLKVCQTLKRIGTDEAIERLRDARREVNDYELRTEIEQLIQIAEQERQQSTVDVNSLRSPTPQPESPNLSPDADETEKLPEHDVIEIIGSGGNADVKKVRLSKTGDTAALKIPRWQGTLSEAVVDEFRTEAATWSRIDDHANIIDVLGSGALPHPWILLEYMPDGNLRERLDDEVPEAATAQKILLGICKAIRHAHRHGIVHADLKPENVLFTGDTPKIGDWGLAKVLLEHSTSIEGLTPSYSAPEQLDPDQYGSVDDTTDVYQLGIIGYELLTGEIPYKRANPAGTVTAILNDTPTPPTEHNSALPPSVDDVIMTAIAKEKNDRYESVLYLRDEFKDLGL